MESYSGEGRNDSLDLLLVANKRKPNFTEGESLYLISQFERNAKILTSKLNDAATNKQKVEVWKRICGDYNSKNPIVLRTANDLKRKWKNMVRAAKKELLESITPSAENGQQSVSQRKLSPVSQRIVDILRITISNCGSLVKSPGLENEFDGSFNETDQASVQACESNEDDGSETSVHEDCNGLQHVVHVVVGQDVKPSVLDAPSDTEEIEGLKQSNHDRESQFSGGSAAVVCKADDQEKHDTVNASPGGSGNVVVSSSTVPVTVVSAARSFPRQLPSTSNTSHAISSSSKHQRVLLPQQRRMLPSSISHVISSKRRKLSDQYFQDEPSSHVRAEIDRLKKDKLILEKEKLALEKEKLVMEKEKLSLEIRFLRDQMD